MEVECRRRRGGISNGSLRENGELSNIASRIGVAAAPNRTEGRQKRDQAR